MKIDEYLTFLLVGGKFWGGSWAPKKAKSKLQVQKSIYLPYIYMHTKFEVNRCIILCFTGGAHFGGLWPLESAKCIFFIIYLYIRVPYLVQNKVL